MAFTIKKGGIPIALPLQEITKPHDLWFPFCMQTQKVEANRCVIEIV